MSELSKEMFEEIISRLDSLEEGVNDWRENLEDISRDKVDWVVKSIGDKMREEIKMFNYHCQTIVGNLHTLQLRLHNIDLRLDELSKPIRKKKVKGQ